MKSILFVEGPTEGKALPAFFKRWLDTQLTQPVGINTVKFDGWPELVHKVERKASFYFNRRDQQDIIAIISLIDLYGPTIYPNHILTAKERFDWLKHDLERKVDHPRFRQFFAVHETEAWLLSQPELFPAKVHNAFPGNVDQPETVNFHEPPAKLLERLYRDKLHSTYKKVVHGSTLFAQLDPQIAYDKCPKLKELPDEMLKLAKEAAT